MAVMLYVVAPVALKLYPVATSLHTPPVTVTFEVVAGSGFTVIVTVKSDPEQLELLNGLTV
jgi:hypothetical protein